MPINTFLKVWPQQKSQECKLIQDTIFYLSIGKDWKTITSEDIGSLKNR